MADSLNEPLLPAHDQLSLVADQYRKELFTKNGYKPTGQDANLQYDVNFLPGEPRAGGEYSDLSPDAISDGDDMGRGYNGTDLGKDLPDKVGTIVDQVERKDEIVKNTYKTTNEYPNF